MVRMISADCTYDLGKLHMPSLGELYIRSWRIIHTILANYIHTISVGSSSGGVVVVVVVVAAAVGVC